MKKIGKAIAKKFKNRKGSKIQEPSISSREEAKKPLEITIEQQPTVVTAKTTTAKDENSKGMHEVCKYSVINKDTTRVIDKATETNTQLCNEKSEIEQPIFENSEEAQNDSTTVEPTSVDRETNEQEPNSPDSPSSAEPHFDSRSGNTIEEKSSKKAIRPIVAGVVGAVLLASGVALCIMKMSVVAAVVGIVGLACIDFALYNIINPNTKLEKVEDVEQLDLQNLKASLKNNKRQEGKLISLENTLNY
ncbi:MAG: hypothetical protein ABS808_02610 [Wolbachia endosymbiont of Polyergus mexicanus]|uniref:Uncharacterized protein n=1 Tax=Wolbachia endosymbiont of Polyergus mexicanus TaxID=3171167 RepID=A0AAU7YJ88_9RICK